MCICEIIIAKYGLGLGRKIDQNTTHTLYHICQLCVIFNPTFRLLACYYDNFKVKLCAESAFLSTTRCTSHTLAIREHTQL